MAFIGHITIGEQAGTRHRVRDHATASICSCGWAGTFAAATEHLYGDLTGAARRFAEGQIRRHAQ